MAREKLELPVQIVGRVDVGRLVHELEALEEWLEQAAIRKSNDGTVLPRTSRLLEEFATTNQLNFLQVPDRQAAHAFLKQLYDSAPTIHISFASDPSAAFTRKIVAWLRGNIHPQILLSVGLEPGIAAGCLVRTTNKQFDFSLRHRFDANRELLSSMLSGKVGQ